MLNLPKKKTSKKRTADLPKDFCAEIFGRLLFGSAFYFFFISFLDVPFSVSTYALLIN